MMYPAAAVRQGCTRSVVLSSCCLVPVICGVGKVSDTKHNPWCVRKNTAYVEFNVRMGWYINYYYKVPYISAQSGVSYGHATTMDMRTQRQHSRKMWYGGVTNGRPRHKQLAAA